MTQIGIFGANGFIGRHLTRAVVARGHKTVCFARHFPLDFQQELGGSVEMRLIDLHDDIEMHTKGRGITHVVQLINSSNAAMQSGKVVADLRSNLIPHVSFINSCILAGVRSFTFLSSGGTVYGRPQIVPIPEDHPTVPLNSYGLTKLATEQYLRMLCRDTPMGFTILRAANPFGPGQLGIGGQGLIGTILQKFKQGEPLTIFGDGLSERELEVLRLLATELTGPEIAQRLYVSLNTLRTHTKHIFTKLDVNTRRAAVRRATERHLL